MATTTNTKVTTQAELIQLIRTCNLHQVSTQLAKDFDENPERYETLVKFYRAAAQRRKI